jgi:hypothetical protein
VTVLRNKYTVEVGFLQEDFLQLDDFFLMWEKPVQAARTCVKSCWVARRNGEKPT